MMYLIHVCQNRVYSHYVIEMAIYAHPRHVIWKEHYMGFLRWLGGIVVFFWLIGLLFKVGGGLIHILLVIAAIVFIMDFIKGKVN